jgi:hypothetical protein
MGRMDYMLGSTTRLAATRRLLVRAFIVLMVVPFFLQRGPTAHHALAQPMSIPAATTNPYWAGYVKYSSPGYVAVSAVWTVPHVTCSGKTDSSVYVWLGEGGYLQGIADPLLQAGTASECMGGRAMYRAFYEWYPGIYATDFPVTLSPGDAVSASVVETQWGVWTLTATDLSDKSSSSITAAVPVDARTADFVVERPTECSMVDCLQLPLAHFAPITFRSIRTLAAPGTAEITIPIALQSEAGGPPLAVPAASRGSPDTLSVLWRGER